MNIDTKEEEGEAQDDALMNDASTDITGDVTIGNQQKQEEEQQRELEALSTSRNNEKEKMKEDDDDDDENENVDGDKTNNNNNNAMDTTGESSSCDSMTGGSGGGKSSSGSGTGGYSADCSASDQSSDEGVNKAQSKDPNTAGTGPGGEEGIPNATTTSAGSTDKESTAAAVAAAAPLLMKRLGIHDDDDEEEEEDDMIKTGQRDGTAAVAAPNPDQVVSMGQHASHPKKGNSQWRSKVGDHQHHHHHHADDASQGIDQDEIDLENILKSCRASGTAGGGKFLDSNNIPLPLKSPDLLDIGSIWKARAQLELENASFIHLLSLLSPSAPTSSSTTFPTKKPPPPPPQDTPQAHAPPVSAAWLPQLNGVRVGNPMDPRIDLSSVSVLANTNNAVFPLAPAVGRSASATVPPTAADKIGQYKNDDQKDNPETLPNSATSSNFPVETPSVNSYLQLLDMVRPFFVSHGVLLANHLIANQQLQHHQQQQQQRLQDQEEQQKQDTSDSDKKDQQQVDSSEGFTSFFTTTHSSQQSGSSSGEGGQKKTFSQPVKSTTALQEEYQQHDVQGGPSKQGEDDTNKSDSSSMVVLARTKRKHLIAKSDDQPASGQQATTGLEAAGGNRRVRIQEKHKDWQEDGEEEEEEDSSMDRKPPAQERHIPQPAVSRGGPDETPDSSASSSSPAPIPAAGACYHHHHHHLHHHRGAVPLPSIVTDVSSSARTDTTGPSATSSGSAGNNTGSGSNQGSSGSGNEFNKGSASEEGGKAGSSEEGKGGSASDEQILADGVPKDNNRRGVEKQSHELGGSDQSETKMHAPAATPAKASDHHHDHRNEVNAPSGGHTATNTVVRKENMEAERERKLQDKKRKRIEMRREYEAQQDLESSASSDHKQEVFFRPGKPITFDQVLQFSKIPRIIIQSTAPFLIVHANAAFTRLTGIDSHKVVGKAIRHVLTLPENALEPDRQAGDGVGGENSSSASGNPQSSEVQQSSVLSNQNDAAGRLMRQNNHHGRRHHSRYHQTTLERLVAASGFGRLHLVHVVSKNPQLVGKSVAVPNEGQSHFAAAGGGGRREAMANSSAVAAAGRHNAAGGRGTRDLSLSSNTTAKHPIPCRASIAPIVSELPSTIFYSQATGDDEGNDAKRRKLPGSTIETHTAVVRVGAKEHDTYDFSSSISKRRKLQASAPPAEPPGSTRRIPTANEQQRAVITHYVIQLEEGDRNVQPVGSLDSISSNSTSVEAQLLNMSKQDIRHQRMVTLGTENRHANTNIAVEMGADQDGGSSESSPVVPLSAVG
ncbi:hypothetical protein ACA910_008744 [Epithemia clementina (nom. ined.)]